MSFPEILDIREYMMDSNDDDYRYQLAAVVKHIGPSVQSDHYTSTARANDGKLYEFNDERDSAVTIGNVLRSEAYMLFYERIYSTSTTMPIALIQRHENMPKSFDLTAVGYKFNGKSFSYVCV